MVLRFRSPLLAFQEAIDERRRLAQLPGDLRDLDALPMRLKVLLLCPERGVWLHGRLRRVDWGGLEDRLQVVLKPRQGPETASHRTHKTLKIGAHPDLARAGLEESDLVRRGGRHRARNQDVWRAEEARFQGSPFSRRFVGPLSRADPNPLSIHAIVSARARSG